MLKRYLIVSCLTAVLMFPLSASAKNRILYVDSYHAGYGWSDGITEGIQSVLQNENVELKIFRMDTKRNTSEDFKKKAALGAKAVIEEYNPDVVIASDDNASKFLIQPYYKNASLPFVFCGVNYSGDSYGYPYKNVTGMVEVSPMTKLIYSLKHFNRAEKVAMLIGDSYTDHKDAESYSKIVNLPFDVIHVADFDQWKDQFVKVQYDYNILLLGNIVSIKGWDDKEAQRVVLSNTRIPTGCDLDFVAPYAFLAYTRVAQEQGRYAAQTALKIIDGTAPSEIPVTNNVEGDLIINLKVAKAGGFKVPNSMLRKAKHVIE